MSFSRRDFAASLYAQNLARGREEATMIARYFGDDQKVNQILHHDRGMGKKNKAIELTDRKIRYFIRAKIRGDSTNRIAQEMKLSPSTVKCVRMHWTKTKIQLYIKKFGRKKKTLDEESVKLILEVHKEQNLGARRLERIIEFTHGRHILHNAIYKEQLSHGLANVNRNKSKRRNPWIRFERKHSLSMMHLDWHTSIHDGKKGCSPAQFLMIVRDEFSRAGSSMPKQQIMPYSSSKKLWADLAG